MRVYGNLINRIMEDTMQGRPDPVVGMGVTICAWSDRYPGTIVKVSTSGKTITVREDIATRTDDNGASEAQSYAFSPAPDGQGRERQFRRNANGHWRGIRTSNGLIIGMRQKYHDYSF